jgi:hypothetical protein
VNRTIIKILTIILGVAACIGMLASTVIADTGEHDYPDIAPIDSHPYGKSYGEWAKAWWTWRLETPYDINPSVNNNPCNGGQSGHVWFLASDVSVNWWNAPGVQEFRSCTLPAGNSLFFPLINNGYFAFHSDPPAERTHDFVRSASRCAGPVKISVKIDGEIIDNPYQYYEESPFFTIHLPADSIYKKIYPTAMTWEPSADSGYYLFLRPLPVGRHVLEWTSEWHNCSINQYSIPDVYYILNYTIKVVPN